MSLNLIYQLKQFFKPFPDVGSWSYRIQVWWSDRHSKDPVTLNISIDPSKEAVSNDNDNEIGKYDSPAYLRKYGDNVSSAADSNGTTTNRRELTDEDGFASRD